ncbi:hypothetical protein AGLY_006119 [Aphis glycines]|uniref:Uncharacterized protein n=1 Tax=Aphis glycines TaxID=307491 RepID=A0A6G0TTA3_APHGL|nr:hypothetical protein AGLY_006119 [Aphis glycines]
MGSARLVYDRVETVVVIGGVRDFTCGAVRFDQAVFTLDNITVPLFPLVLDIAGVVVLHAVVERVLGWRLQYRSNAIVEAISSLGHNNIAVGVRGIFPIQCTEDRYHYYYNHLHHSRSNRRVSRSSWGSRLGRCWQTSKPDMQRSRRMVHLHNRDEGNQQVRRRGGNRSQRVQRRGLVRNNNIVITYTLNDQLYGIAANIDEINALFKNEIARCCFHPQRHTCSVGRAIRSHRASRYKPLYTSRCRSIRTCCIPTAAAYYVLL